MLHTMNPCVEGERNHEQSEKIDRAQIAKKLNKVLKRKIREQDAQCILSFLEAQFSGAKFNISNIPSDKSILHSLISLENQEPFAIVLAACALKSEKRLRNAVKRLIHIKNDVKFTPFLHAVKNERYKAVQLLLQYKELLEFDVLEKTPMFGLSALHYASKFANCEMCKILLQDKLLRANVNIKDGFAYTPAHYAAQNAGDHNIQILELLKFYNADFTKKAFNGKTAIDEVLSASTNSVDVILSDVRKSYSHTCTNLIKHIEYIKGFRRSDTRLLMNVTSIDDGLLIH